MIMEREPERGRRAPVLHPFSPVGTLLLADWHCMAMDQALSSLRNHRTQKERQHVVLIESHSLMKSYVERASGHWSDSPCHSMTMTCCLGSKSSKYLCSLDTFTATPQSVETDMVVKKYSVYRQSHQIPLWTTVARNRNIVSEISDPPRVTFRSRLSLSTYIGNGRIPTWFFSEQEHISLFLKIGWEFSLQKLKIWATVLNGTNEENIIFLPQLSGGKTCVIWSNCKNEHCLCSRGSQRPK